MFDNGGDSDIKFPEINGRSRNNAANGLYNSMNDDQRVKLRNFT